VDEGDEHQIALSSRLSRSGDTEYVRRVSIREQPHLSPLRSGPPPLGGDVQPGAARRVVEPSRIESNSEDFEF
jgi:hypothetical protein